TSTSSLIQKSHIGASGRRLTTSSRPCTTSRRDTLPLLVRRVPENQPCSRILSEHLRIALFATTRMCATQLGAALVVAKQSTFSTTSLWRLADLVYTPARPCPLTTSICLSAEFVINCHWHIASGWNRVTAP